MIHDIDIDEEEEEGEDADNDDEAVHTLYHLIISVCKLQRAFGNSGPCFEMCQQFSRTTAELKSVEKKDATRWNALHCGPRCLGCSAFPPECEPMIYNHAHSCLSMHQDRRFPRL